jgi:hypothetical protein
MKILLVGWAGDRRYDLDFCYSHLIAINNHLLMDGNNVISVTVEALQLANHGIE